MTDLVLPPGPSWTALVFGIGLREDELGRGQTCEAAWMWEPRDFRGDYLPSAKCERVEQLFYLSLACRSCSPGAMYRCCQWHLGHAQRGIAHQAPWCVYCTYPMFEHEVTGIEEIQ